MFCFEMANQRCIPTGEYPELIKQQTNKSFTVGYSTDDLFAICHENSDSRKNVFWAADYFSKLFIGLKT